MKEFSYKELLEILEKEEDIQKIYENKFKDVKKAAVLGIDLYRYSSMEENERNLVPFIGQILRDKAIELCLSVETCIFQNKSKEDFNNNFINTGDGGYFIFDTPLHAFVFAIYFEMAVRALNSYKLYPALRKIIKQRPILRYAMTYDKVYKYEKSSYGLGIITNARILSKDKLDRFLIDENVYNWFMENTNGIDNLQVQSLEDLMNIQIFKTYMKEDSTFKSLIFPNLMTLGKIGKTNKFNTINSLHVQKIGEVKAKNDEISIYNLYIQLSTLMGEEISNSQKLTVSLGNLNVSGISE